MKNKREKNVSSWITLSHTFNTNQDLLWALPCYYYYHTLYPFNKLYIFFLFLILQNNSRNDPHHFHITPLMMCWQTAPHSWRRRRRQKRRERKKTSFKKINLILVSFNLSSQKLKLTIFLELSPSKHITPSLTFEETN